MLNYLALRVGQDAQEKVTYCDIYYLDMLRYLVSVGFGFYGPYSRKMFKPYLRLISVYVPA